MTSGRFDRRMLRFLAAAILILCADTLAVRFAAPGDERMLAFAVLADTAVVLPLIYYFIVARHAKRRWTSALPAVAIGLAAAWLILPPEERSAVGIAEALLLPLEIAVIGYEVRLALRFIRAYRAERTREPDPAEALRKAVRGAIGAGKLASLVLHDFVMYYYALFSWRRKAPAAVGGEAFAYGEGRRTMATVFSAILVLDAFAFHLLLALWSHVAAWIVTASHLWFLLFFLADCRASGLRRVTLGNDRLRIRYGLKLQADIPLGLIASAESAMEFRPSKAERRTAAEASVSMQPANVVIRLRETHAVETLLFLPRQVDTIYLVMDDPGEFVSALNRAVVGNKPITPTEGDVEHEQS